MFHTNVCAFDGCSCVFPDQRLLSLVSNSSTRRIIMLTDLENSIKQNATTLWLRYARTVETRSYVPVQLPPFP